MNYLVMKDMMWGWTEDAWTREDNENEWGEWEWLCEDEEWQRWQAGAVSNECVELREPDCRDSLPGRYRMARGKLFWIEKQLKYVKQKDQ